MDSPPHVGGRHPLCLFCHSSFVIRYSLFSPLINDYHSRMTSRWDRPAWTLPDASHFEHLLELRQVTRAVGGDERQVLQAHASAEFPVVEAGFNGHHLAGVQAVLRHRPDARTFMQFQPDPVAGAVEKAVHAPVLAACFVALVLEEFENRGVDFLRLGAVAKMTQGKRLRAADGVVKLADGLAGPAPHDGAGDVAEVTGLLGAREDVEDNGFVGPQEARAAFVRIASLPAAGNDRMARQAAGLNDGRVDDGAELL